MGLGMHLFLLRSRRNRCAPFPNVILCLYRNRCGFCQRSIIGDQMELHTENTENTDKMLESLAPVLSAELARILEGNRRQLEEEFRKRMDAAVSGAETAAKG